MGRDPSHSPRKENSHSVEAEMGMGNCCERGKGLVHHLGEFFLIFLFHHPWENCLHREDHSRLSESIQHLEFYFIGFSSRQLEKWSSSFAAYALLLKLLSRPISQMTTGANARHGMVNYTYYICIYLLWQSLCQHWALTMHITVELMYFWWHILQCYI